MVRRLSPALALALLLLPGAASPVFHFAVIHEVLTSYGGDAGVQFVEIRMLSFGQTVTGNSVLGVFDDGGALLDDYVVPGNVPNGGAGVTWLMASAGFQTETGVAPDFTVDVALPVAGGMVCWGAPGSVPPNPASWDHADPANYVDCLAYGSYAGPSNALVGTPTPLDAAGHGLLRTTDTNDNADDFACSDPATPTNNSGSEAVLPATTPCPAPPVCGDGALDPGELCDDGNTAGGDGCSADCIPELCGDGVLEPVSEECDDGNTVDLDGCTGCLLDCGNGTLDPLEECDDGNRTGGDGCDESCIAEVCGNGVVQAGECCDDGNTIGGDGCDELCETTVVPLDRDQSRCIVDVNKGFAAVAKAAGKLSVRCLKAIAAGKQAGDLASCLAADARGKVAKAQGRTLRAESRRCSPAPPPFAYTDAPTANAAAASGTADAVADVFGGAPIADKKTEKEPARCQLAVAGAVAKLADASAKAFVKQKRLVVGRAGLTCRAVLELSALGEAALLGEKPAKAAAKGAAKIAKKCPAGDLSPHFAAGLGAGSAAALADAALARARCRLCEALNLADALVMDCDAVDDGAANASCP